MAIPIGAMGTGAITPIKIPSRETAGMGSMGIKITGIKTSALPTTAMGITARQPTAIATA